MNPEPRHHDSPAETASPLGSASPSRLVNPNLSGSLAADYEALQNDMVQAQELAADFQRQLAGKSNELAQLKQILEKTQADLAHLQEGIVELRAERHRLANEALRATAYQAKLARVTAERDHLRIDLEVVRQALARKADEMTMELQERDRRIAELAVEMVGLRAALGEAQNPSAPPSSARKTAPERDSEEECIIEIQAAPSLRQPAK
jgi:chromosome segregation ATPase